MFARFIYSLMVIWMMWSGHVCMGNTEIVRFRPSDVVDSPPSLITDDPNRLVPVEIKGPYSMEQLWINPHFPLFLRLSDIDAETFYTLRISYLATNPTDFEMSLFRENPDDVASLFLSIEATHTGVSMMPNLHKRPVPFILVLEKLYFGFLSLQILRLIAVLALILLLTFTWVLSRIFALFEKEATRDVVEKDAPSHVHQE